jgi:hypothetical protein
LQDDLWLRAKLEGDKVSGQALATGGTTMLVTSAGDDAPTEVSLFGVKTDDSVEGQRKVASHIAALVSNTKGANGMHVACTRPDFAGHEWTCLIGDGTESRGDLALSLLQRGVVVVEPEALAETPVRFDYLRAQALGQANGCGVWAR